MISLSGSTTLTGILCAKPTALIGTPSSGTSSLNFSRPHRRRLHENSDELLPGRFQLLSPLSYPTGLGAGCSQHAKSRPHYDPHRRAVGLLGLHGTSTRPAG